MKCIMERYSFKMELRTYYPVVAFIWMVFRALHYELAKLHQRV